MYTNIIRHRSKIVEIGRDNQRNQTINSVSYKPTLYLNTTEKSKYADIYGVPVKPFVQDTMMDAKKFIEKYDGVGGKTCYGMERYIYQYLNEKYPEDIKDFDTSDVRKFNFDIEVSPKKFDGMTTKVRVRHDETGKTALDYVDFLHKYNDGFSIQEPDESWVPVSKSSYTKKGGFPEPGEAKYPINAIAVLDSFTGEYHVFAFREDYKPKQENVIFHKADNEMLMMLDFIRYFRSNRPDIITGWNIKTFDVPYIVNRCKNLEMESVYEMSPIGVINEKSIKGYRGKETQIFNIEGVSTLDYIDLYKHYVAKTSESYALNYVSHTELGEKKVDFAEEQSLGNLYEQNFPKFIDYNIRDVWLVDKLDQKFALLDLIITAAYESHCNYEDVMSQVRAWDCIIYNYLRRQNIVIPLSGYSQSEHYEGAYVKEPKPALYNWIASVDLASLYPSIIMGTAISPENLVTQKELEAMRTPENSASVDFLLEGLHFDGTLVPDVVSVNKTLAKDLDPTFQKALNDLDLTVGMQGSLFLRKAGFFPELLEKFYKERKHYKRKMLEAQNNVEAIKVEMTKRGITA